MLCLGFRVATRQQPSSGLRLAVQHKHLQRLRFYGVLLSGQSLMVCVSIIASCGLVINVETQAMIPVHLPLLLLNWSALMTLCYTMLHLLNTSVSAVSHSITLQLPLAPLHGACSCIISFSSNYRYILCIYTVQKFILDLYSFLNVYLCHPRVHCWAVLL